jgi:hypothetical protein
MITGRTRGLVVLPGHVKRPGHQRQAARAPRAEDRVPARHPAGTEKLIRMKNRPSGPSPYCWLARMFADAGPGKLAPRTRFPACPGRKRERVLPAPRNAHRPASVLIITQPVSLYATMMPHEPPAVKVCPAANGSRRASAYPLAGACPTSPGRRAARGRYRMADRGPGARVIARDRAAGRAPGTGCPVIVDRNCLGEEVGRHIDGYLRCELQTIGL